MISFMQLPSLAKSFLLMLYCIVILFAMYLTFVRIVRMKRPEPVSTAVTLVLLALMMMFKAAIKCEARQLPADYPVSAADRLPVAVIILIPAVSAAYCIRGLLKEADIYRNTVTSGAIKEAIDDVPVAVSFFEPNGLPVLVNHRMYELALEFTGRQLQGCEEFWGKLSEASKAEADNQLQNVNSPVLTRLDGSVWSFCKKNLEINGKSYTQITASDITKRYRLGLELKEKNALLDKQYHRLHAMLTNIVQIKHDEEILASKVRIHGQFGQCVLTTRRMLINGSSEEDIESVAGLWRSMTGKIRAGFAEEMDEDNTKAQLEEATAAMGCGIKFKGALPENDYAAYLILSAVREAVTNAVRHADADTVTAEITQTDTEYSAIIYDNGSKKPESIKEGGGLGGLRQKIERAGGRLEVKCENGVRLYVRLLRKGNTISG